MHGFSHQVEEDLLLVGPTKLGQWLRHYHTAVRPVFPARGATFSSIAIYINCPQISFVVMIRVSVQGAVVSSLAAC